MQLEGAPLFENCAKGGSYDPTPKALLIFSVYSSPPKFSTAFHQPTLFPLHS